MSPAEMDDDRVIAVMKVARDDVQDANVEDPIQRLAEALCTLLAGFLDIVIEDAEK